MPNRFDEITRRKEILIERCALERNELAAALDGIHLPLNLGAILAKLGKLLQAYPLAAGLSSLFVTGYGFKLTRTAAKFVAMARIVGPVRSWWTKRDRAK